MNAGVALPSYVIRGASSAFGLMPRLLVVFAGAYVAGRYLPSGGLVVCAAAAGYALRGPRQTVEALTILALIIMVPGTAGMSVGRWLVLFAGIGRVAYDTLFRNAPLPPLAYTITAFALVVSLLGVIASWLPVISVFKAVAFWMGAVTTVTSFYRTRHLGPYWWRWMFSFALFVVGLSAVIFATGGGYGRGSDGFQGITSHPQTFGPISAVFAVFIGSLLWFKGVRSRVALAAVGLALAWVYLSGARTGLFSVLLGLALVVAFSLFRSRSWLPVLQQKVFTPQALFVGFVMTFVLLLAGDVIGGGARAFLLKREETGEVADALTSSREVLIEKSMANFRAHPVTGIGFGVPSDLRKTRIETGFLGLPSGASVEKGFMPSAVLEEIGLIGATLLIALLIQMGAPIVRHGGIMSFWIFTTALMINLGEMVFFSFGGNGCFLWLWYGLCYAVSVRDG